MGKDVTYKTPKVAFVRIFGVLTSPKFEREELTAFLRKHSKQFLEEFLGDGELWDNIVSLKKEAEIEREKKKTGPLIANNCESDKIIQETVVKYLQSKLPEKQVIKNLLGGSTPLNKVFGQILSYGLRKDLIKPHVYSDVPTDLKKWKSKGVKIYTISKIPEKLRKLFFAHTTLGDISGLFEGHLGTQLDENMMDEKGYKAMADFAGEDIGSCLFLVESMTEAKTVTGASGECCVLVREGKPPKETEPSDSGPEISFVSCLDDIVFFES